MKTPRLFVMHPGSDGTWFYCGGIGEAHTGLGNLIESDISELMTGELDVEFFNEEFEVKVQMMTDEEVEQLADF